MKLEYKAVIASITSFVSFFIGGFDELINMLVILMIFDFAMGVFIGYTEKELNSKKMTKGFFKRAAVFVVIMLSVQLSIYFDAEFIRTSTILYYSAVEGLSILENSLKMGIDYPEFLLEFLEHLKKNSDEKKETEGGK